MEKEEQMSIQAFVSDAIYQIKRGIGQNEVKLPLPVSFEIGVVVSNNKSSETKGGLGLSVASVLSLGASGKSSKEAETVTYNKLSFTVELR